MKTTITVAVMMLLSIVAVNAESSVVVMPANQTTTPIWHWLTPADNMKLGNSCYSWNSYQQAYCEIQFSRKWSTTYNFDIFTTAGVPPVNAMGYDFGTNHFYAVRCNPDTFPSSSTAFFYFTKDLNEYNNRIGIGMNKYEKAAMSTGITECTKLNGFSFDKVQACADTIVTSGCWKDDNTPQTENLLNTRCLAVADNT